MIIRLSEPRWNIITKNSAGQSHCINSVGSGCLHRLAASLKCCTGSGDIIDNQNPLTSHYLSACQEGILHIFSPFSGIKFYLAACVADPFHRAGTVLNVSGFCQRPRQQRRLIVASLLFLAWGKWDWNDQIHFPAQLIIKLYQITR